MTPCNSSVLVTSLSRFVIVVGSNKQFTRNVAVLEVVREVEERLKERPFSIGSPDRVLPNPLGVGRFDPWYLMQAVISSRLLISDK